MAAAKTKDDPAAAPAATLPTLFVNHGGGPLPLMEDPAHAGLAASLRGVGARLGGPGGGGLGLLRAIVVISAHWIHDGSFRVLGGRPPALLFDYSGFPPQTYAYEYSPPPADPAVAQRVRDLLIGAGLPAELDRDERPGFDHGVFVPLMLAFPEAQVPVVQLSLKGGLDPSEHLRAGHALAPLREEGILIIGSGMTYHNMGEFFRSTDPQSQGGKDSLAFDDWLGHTLTEMAQDPDGAADRLVQWETEAPRARACHPQEEHLAPMFVVAGAGTAGARATRVEKIFDGRVMGKKVTSFMFTAEEDDTCATATGT